DARQAIDLERGLGGGRRDGTEVGLGQEVGGGGQDAGTERGPVHPESLDVAVALEGDGALDDELVGAGARVGAPARREGALDDLDLWIDAPLPVLEAGRLAVGVGFGGLCSSGAAELVRRGRGLEDRGWRRRRRRARGGLGGPCG